MAQAADPALSGSKLRANIVANYLGKLWSVASIYLFVPLYIQALGMSAYGLIAFHGVALAILFVADAGLSAAFSRQAARVNNRAELLNQLKSTETLLFAALIVGGALMMAAAPWVARHWLKPSADVPEETVILCLRLMPLALVPQVAMSLYMGGLMGRQRQVAANGWQSAFTAARAAGVLLPLAWRPELSTFFAWQVACGWCFLVMVRHALHRDIAGGHQASSGHFSWDSVRVMGGYAAGMFAMALISGLNTQLDRLVVSRLRPLEEFALYSLAATLAQIPTMITAPVSAALLPRLTQLVEAGDNIGLRRLYRLGTLAIAALATASAGLIALFANELLALWLPGQALPDHIGAVVAVLALGGLLLALQLMPFQLSLAHGHNATNVKLGLATLVVSVPLQVFLTLQFGLVGAAVPWALVGLVGFVFLGIALNRRFQSGTLRHWFLSLNLLPALTCLLPLLVAQALAKSQAWSTWTACAAGAVAALLGLGVSAWLARRMLMSNLGR